MTNEFPTADRSSRPELSGKVANKKPLIIAGIVALLLIIGSVGLAIFLFRDPMTTAVLRDMSIILIAVLSILILFVMLVILLAVFYIVLKVNDIVHLLNNEVTPLIEKANKALALTQDTAKAVQSRAILIGDEAVKPIINLVSMISAIKSVLKTLFGRL